MFPPGPTGPFLAPGLLATALTSRAILLGASALAGACHISSNNLVNQVFVVLPSESNIRNGHCARSALPGFNTLQFHVRDPLTLSLDRGTNDNVTTGSTWYGTLDKQQIALSINPDNFQTLGGYILGTHVAGHFLALPNATRGLTLANRSGGTVRQRVTVGGILHGESSSA